MKKINLNNLHHHAIEVLTREQLKNILGGDSLSTTRCKDKCTTIPDSCPTGYFCGEIKYPDGKTCLGCVQNELRH